MLRAEWLVLQADVFHAYQVLTKGGLKEENIVMFMYNDIENNIIIPQSGIIINHPEGQDVYVGVRKVIYFYKFTLLFNFIRLSHKSTHVTS